METISEQKLRKQITFWLRTFIILLLLSGITAFPLETELELLSSLTINSPSFIKEWINGIYIALKETNSKYPFLAYGTDWLAFAHIVIAVAFVGPLRDPVKNIWVIQFGMIACVMVFPLALICGPIRHIPFYWQLIDCSFGLFGFLPLYYCYKNILTLDILSNK